jgi:hypothetical protein
MGILCGILSLVGVVIDGINMNKYCSYYPYYGYDINNQYFSSYNNCRQYRNSGVLFGFNMTCLIFSGWVSLQDATQDSHDYLYTTKNLESSYPVSPGIGISCILCTRMVHHLALLHVGCLQK